MRRALVGTLVVLGVGSLVLGDEPRRDRLGDPLPPGATSRLGTSRLLHATNVSAVGFASEDELVSIDEASTVIAWDATTGRELRRLELGRPFDFARFTADARGLLVASERIVSVIDLATITTAAEYTALEDDRIRAISPDGLVAVVHASATDALLVIELANGRVREAITVGEIEAAALGIGGTPLATSLGEEVTIWNGGRPQRIFKAGYEVERLAVSRDGARLAVRGSRLLRIHDVATGRVEREVEDPRACFPDGAFGLNGDIDWNAIDGEPALAAGRGAVFSKRLVAWPAGRGVRVVDRARNELLVRHTRPPDVMWVGERVATFDPLEVPLIWNAAGVASALPAFASAISSDGKVAFQLDGHHLRVRSIETGADLAAVVTDRVESFQLSPDARRVGLLSPARIVERTGNVTFLEDPAAKPKISAIAFSPTSVVAVRYRRGGVGLLEGPGNGEGIGVIESGLTLFRTHEPIEAGPVFSCDGRHVAAISSGALVVRDAVTGRVVGRVPGVNAFAFGPDRLATVEPSAEGQVIVLRKSAVDELDELARFPVASRVHALAFSEGGTLATSHEDTTVLLWERR